MLALLPPAQTVPLTSRGSTATEGPLISNNLRFAASPAEGKITASRRELARPTSVQCAPESSEPKMWPSAVPRKIRAGREGSAARARTSPPGGPSGFHAWARTSVAESSKKTIGKHLRMAEV